jgi:ribosomal protein S3AE
MATTIETDLKEILGEFKQEFSKLNQRLDRIEGDLTSLKVDMATVTANWNRSCHVCKPQKPCLELIW